MILLDLYCGAGGAAMGYARAGFTVLGVDIRSQPRYPFPMVVHDALTFPLEGFDVIHASPPCQRFSSVTRRHGQRIVEGHPDLVALTRERLVESGTPYVMENVSGSPLQGSMLLCGSMFGLGVRRHRIFEGFTPLLAPASCNHAEPAVPVYGHTGAGVNRGAERDRGRLNGVAEWREAMGIPWMTSQELVEAIPPAYTEWLGSYLWHELHERERIA